jgi:hypothetical protein
MGVAAGVAGLAAFALTSRGKKGPGG